MQPLIASAHFGLQIDGFQSWEAQFSSSKSLISAPGASWPHLQTWISTTLPGTTRKAFDLSGTLGLSWPEAALGPGKARPTPADTGRHTFKIGFRPHCQKQRGKRSIYRALWAFPGQKRPWALGRHGRHGPTLADTPSKLDFDFVVRNNEESDRFIGHFEHFLARSGPGLDWVEFRGLWWLNPKRLDSGRLQALCGRGWEKNASMQRSLFGLLRIKDIRFDDTPTTTIPLWRWWWQYHHGECRQSSDEKP